jgi:hypothetical protein
MKPLILNGPHYITNQIINKLFAGFDRKRAVLIDALKSPFLETVLLKEVSRVLKFDVLFIRNYPASKLTNDHVYPIADAKQIVLATDGRHALTGCQEIKIHDFSNFNSIDKIDMFEYYFDLAKAELNIISLIELPIDKDLLEQYKFEKQEAKAKINKRIELFNRFSKKYPEDFNCKVKQSA